MAAIALMTACASAGSDAGNPVPIDSPPSIDAPPPIDAKVDLCPSGTTCPVGMMLGMVSGDTGLQTLTAMGYQSAWIQVRVTENYNDLDGVAMSLAATLTSPAGVDFDVFVYMNAGNDVVECSTTVGTTTTNGTVNRTRAVWGEGAVSNGVNDSRTVSIEIRPISGTCAPDQAWQLLIEGNV